MLHTQKKQTCKQKQFKFATVGVFLYIRVFIDSMCVELSNMEASQKVNPDVAAKDCLRKYKSDKPPALGDILSPNVPHIHVHEDFKRTDSAPLGRFGTRQNISAYCA